MGFEGRNGHTYCTPDCPIRMILMEQEKYALFMDSVNTLKAHKPSQKFSSLYILAVVIT